MEQRIEDELTKKKEFIRPTDVGFNELTHKTYRKLYTPTHIHRFCKTTYK